MTTQTVSDEPEAPARVISANFRQDRNLSPRAGAKKGWRVLSPFEAAFEKGQLRGPEKNPVEALNCQNARWTAGNAYADLYHKAQPARQDAIFGGGSTGGSGGDSAAVARIHHGNALAAVDARLPRKDREILAYVLGEEMTISQAVQAALGADYERAAQPRFRESLDRLVEVLDR